MTPLRAIRKVCIACVGSPYEVKDCGGDSCLGVQGDEKGVCYLFPFRLTKGRPSENSYANSALSAWVAAANGLLNANQIVPCIHIALARIQNGQDLLTKALSNRL